MPGPLSPSVCLELTLPPTQLNWLLILPGRKGGLVVSLGRVSGAEMLCLGPAVDPLFLCFRLGDRCRVSPVCSHTVPLLVLHLGPYLWSRVPSASLVLVWAVPQQQRSR